MKSKLLTILLIFLTAVPVLAQDQRPALVRVAKAVIGNQAGTASMIGTLYFERASLVSPEEAARVTQVNFKSGSRVKKGEILVRMDSRILEQELALQKAKLAQVNIRMKKTKLNLDRYSQLFKKEIATESDYDDIRLTYEEQHQERIAITRQVDILTLRLSKHTIRAPFDGIILDKQVEIGEWVGPGSVLCNLGAIDALFARVPVAEHLIRFTQTGDLLPVRINAFEKDITGIVEGLDPMADPKTKNISLKLRLDYSGPVAVNMSVTVQVPISKKKELVLLPRDALVQFQGQDMVYMVKENAAVPANIEVVYASGDKIGITPGAVSPGTTVVTQGNERLKPGQPVMVQGEQN